MMTKEQYESLHLADLRGLAKTRGVRRTSTMRKGELIAAMLELDAQNEETEETTAVETEAEAESEVKPEAKPIEAKPPLRELPSAFITSETPVQTTERAEQAANRYEQQNSRYEQPNNRYEQQNNRYEQSNNRYEQQNNRYEQANNRYEAQGSRYEQQFPNRYEGRYSRSDNREQRTDYRERGNYYRSNADSPMEGGREEQRSRIPGDTGQMAEGILEVMPDGYGFLRSDNFQTGDDDVYVSPSQIRRFNLKTGDLVIGNKREKAQGERYGALLYVSTVNGGAPDEAKWRVPFEKMTPIFPNKRIRLERPDGSRATRIVDLVSPIGYGQRGMIVSPPKAGKTTLLKDVAKSILSGDPKANLIILLIDERPEEVTDMRESVSGENVTIIASTFDEKPDHHRKVAEIVLERAKRLVENHQDVIILLDSITRLTRAYNLLVPQSGRTLSGGLDPAALHDPKRFFGAARNMREGGSLTILATALVDTGSKMDDVVYEEFKGTGNMELILDRKLQERRIFPAIDIVRSGTRRDDLLLNEREQKAFSLMRRRINGQKAEESIESVLSAFARYPNNDMVVQAILQKWQ